VKVKKKNDKQWPKVYEKWKWIETYNEVDLDILVLANPCWKWGLQKINPSTLEKFLIVTWQLQIVQLLYWLGEKKRRKLITVVVDLE